MSVEGVRAVLAGNRYDTVAEIVVCDQDRLVGLINVEDVLAAQKTTLARELMDADPAVVLPGEDQEIAVWKAIRKNETSLAVVDGEGLFIGLIPPPRLVSILLAEHDEDMARLGGFLRESDQARRASVEGVRRRFWHRLPWLLLGLLGAILAAEFVGAFEQQLQQNVLVAFFIPGVVYLADAVGTQTETVVIRGLSVGVPVGQIVRRECITGLLVGCALAAVFFPVALWRWQNTGVAGAVALSLVAACSVATLVAMALPTAFRWCGSDPAFGSGPLATVVQDLVSIVIYFGLSSALVG
jgi:magnesium transporter